MMVGMGVFGEGGIVLLVRVIGAVAAGAGVPILAWGIPRAAALSVTHGFLRPHPAPTAMATALNAPAGMVLAYGIIVAIPAVYIAGPLFSRFAK